MRAVPALQDGLWTAVDCATDVDNACQALSNEKLIATYLTTTLEPSLSLSTISQATLKMIFIGC